jgi:DNA polymerase-1
MWVSRIRKVSGGDEARLSFRAVYAEGIDPHLLTAAAMEAQGGRLDMMSGLLPLDWLRQQDQHALKARMKGPRQAAKAVNFGTLYGQQSAGLHRHGATSYKLTWELEDATQARAAWFKLYPEVGLWHWLLQEAHKEKRDILDPYNSNSFKLKDDTETGAGKVFWGSTLSDRPTVSPKLTSAASFQDQGTGAEIALDALARLPPDVQDMLVNFVHDEMVLEVPATQVEEVQAIVERTMIESADKYLLPFGIPTEVESSVGDCWIH